MCVIDALWQMCFYVCLQVEWRDEVRHHFEKIKSEGTCLHRLDEELIKRRREELRLADTIMTRTNPLEIQMETHRKLLHHLERCVGMWKSYIYGCKKINILINVLFLLFCSRRHALDIREHYERKLERANNLYMELNAIMLQLEIKEKELHKYENRHWFTVDLKSIHPPHSFTTLTEREFDVFLDTDQQKCKL